MINRSNNVLNRSNIRKLRRMKELSHRLCVAPVMDRNDSFAVSIGCEAACAIRVHAPASLYYSAIRSDKNECLASSDEPQGFHQSVTPFSQTEIDPVAALRE